MKSVMKRRVGIPGLGRDDRPLILKGDEQPNIPCTRSAFVGLDLNIPDVQTNSHLYGGKIDSRKLHIFEIKKKKKMS